MCRNRFHHAISMIGSLFSVGAVTGCGENHQYDPPGEMRPAQQERQIHLSKNDAWPRVIANLSKSFFVINNVEPKSGFINVSYASDPDGYVDCGEGHLHNLQYDLDFPIASNHVNYPWAVRKERLSGRVNILLQSSSESTSVIHVNVKYVMTEGFTPLSIDGMFGTNRDYVTSGDFNTNQRGKLGKYDCQPTGDLEYKILNLATQGM